MGKEDTMTTHRDPMDEHARLHISFTTEGDDAILLFDAFSDRGHLLSLRVAQDDIIAAIAGIEHKMNCEIIHLAGAATEQRDLLDKPQQIGYDGCS